MIKTDFASLVNTLCKDQNPRVWSLLVSVFGELGQDQSVRISGSLLTHLTNLMGIKPEATRVAIHRLRKEGWIESQKVGRKSNYFLSSKGLEQSATASPLIYCEQAPIDQAWVVIFEPNSQNDNRPHEGIWITSSILLTTKAPKVRNALVTELDGKSEIPSWITAKICDPAVLKYSQQLATTFADLEGKLRSPTDLSPIEIAALRILIVHAWRLAVLKAPNLSHPFFPTSWKGPDCRTSVLSLLTRLPGQKVADLEAETIHLSSRSPTVCPETTV
ncbi:MAG: PaaX family transcriptional regulator C-terminal domain-containing protein [Sulfitobacter sp.]